MAQPVRIRLANAADGGFIERLVPRFAESGVPPWRTREEIETGTLRQLLAALAAGDAADSAIFIATDAAGGALGFVWVVLTDDFYGGPPMGKISEIAVEESGKGTGRALMQAAEAWACRRGARLMLLNALQNNAYGRRFYALQGYEPEYTAFVKRL
ncbi:MAG: N-acetyltransferase family protein [Candidatus Baltobacteraceae bacterium]